MSQESGLRPCWSNSLQSTFCDSDNTKWVLNWASAPLVGFSGRVYMYMGSNGKVIDVWRFWDIGAGTPGDWSHVLKQIGMFTFTGLDKDQVQFMTREYHIYMTSDGYVNISMTSFTSVAMALLYGLFCIYDPPGVIKDEGKMEGQRQILVTWSLSGETVRNSILNKWWTRALTMWRPFVRLSLIYENPDMTTFTSTYKSLVCGKLILSQHFGCLLFHM